MIVADSLLADMKRLVRDLVDDLRQNASTDHDTARVVEGEYDRAKGAGRTALSRAEWAEGLFAQIAVAWVLGAVFVRFCEDNELIPEALLSGPDRRRDLAIAQRSAYFREHPDRDDRDWCREIFTQLRALPATGDVFGDHNPVWLLAPSADGAHRLVQQFQQIDPDTGEVRHDFRDPAWDTRFLGDLYQDLSDHAKKSYALLQTPVFVEEFILDRTLEPALETFGLRDTTLIDPACGSGHFLLGAFARLFERWSDNEPATNRSELAKRALDAIAGVDLNPFAASIARFRLLVAAMRAAGEKRLADAPAYPIHVAVGDSLLHGDPPGTLPGTTVGDERAAAAAHGYATEDVAEARALLSRSWSAVVGNPPYITVKDPALNSLYRARFTTCRGKYSLGVPFTERFFQLARHDADPERCGYVGMITANSFMKREMGKSLIEQWMPQHDLTHVIDTSGAYIPGHGTPTVILFGRNRRPVMSSVRAVMGIRGEPSTPPEPAKGLVWSSIVELVNEPGASSDYVSVVDLDRSRLAKHPWSIGGGGAAELKAQLDVGRATLRTLCSAIGPATVPGTDDALIAPRDSLLRRGVSLHVELIVGEAVRDFVISEAPYAVFPYDSDILPFTQEALPESELHWLWPSKSVLASYVMFGNTKAQRHLRWFEWGYIIPERVLTPLSITFAFVATHNHFVLDRGGKVFNRSAPVIKLPAGASEEQHLELLGVLNSSTACFWMKQVCHNKGAGGGKRVEAGFSARGAEEWENHFELDATKLQSFPMPSMRNPSTATLLDRLATELSQVVPSAIAATDTPSAERLAETHSRYDDLRAQMVAAQERLDWEVYRAYGLLQDDLTTGAEPEPPLHLGERAFEIVLARKVAAGDEETSWFARHGSTPITELPAHWPDSYRRLVERRIELIGTDRDIGLIERPEHKRRWATKSWADQEKAALRGWLLDRLESPRYWQEPAAITTTARLAAEVRTDPDFMQVARLFAGREDVDGGALIAELVAAEAVPYLAALRFTEAGLRKHAQWLTTWDLQRTEDAGEDVGPIPVPPKYAKGDFTGVAWEHRGKLDVPKERFISYPGAQRESDASLPVGWAGWDHLVRARALAMWYVQAKGDGRGEEHLMPLLAGLAELCPWLLQWHDEPNADPALDRPGSQIAALVEAELRSLGRTAEGLAAWRPVPVSRGRRSSRRSV